MDAHDRPAVTGSDLDEIAQLVHDPQAVAAELFRRRVPPPDQRIDDRAAIGHLAHDAAALGPEPQIAVTASVLHAVPLFSCSRER